jgi:copper chaperone CopZ
MKTNTLINIYHDSGSDIAAETLEDMCIAGESNKLKNCLKELPMTLLNSILLYIDDIYLDEILNACSKTQLVEITKSKIKS